MNHPIKPHFNRLLVACAMFLLGLTAAKAQIKVACVGDSITAGLGIANPGTQSCPAQLQALLGSGYTVQNYGDSGRTLMKNTGYSYWDSWAYTSSMGSSPDIVVIMLGTNDTKAWNWSPANFSTDYNALIAAYQALPSKPKVYVCLAPPVYANTMSFDPAFVQNNLVPAIQGVATSNGLTLIDNNTPLLNHEELFSDGVHPTMQGAGIIASTVADAVAQGPTLGSAGSVAPVPDADDISQLSTTGNVAWPDGINYFTDNNPPVGQTFTTGGTAKKLVSLSVKTAGLNSGGGVGSPASTPTFYLRLYSVSGGTATLLNVCRAANPGFTDGDWLKWSGLDVHLEANQTYAFTLGSKPTGGGWAAMAVATNAYAGGEIATVPSVGGTVTTGTSHNYDAVFSLGLRDTTGPSAIPPLPVPTYGFNLGNTFESTWGYPDPTQAVFNTAANSGFNAIRIPCAWDYNADDTTWQIDPTYMAKVKQAVDWSIAAGMHVVLNCHWDGGWLENNIGDTVDPVINAKMSSYWTQIATTFAGYGNHLLFAGANEPNVHSPAEFNTLMAYYQTFINAVRTVGGGNADRWLVLQGGGDTSWFTTLPPDSTPGRLMVEYHNYTPSLFTIIHEDQSWGNTIYFWGPAYHYAGNPGRNAGFPEEGQIDSGFQQLKTQYVDKGIPVLIGEFQAARKSYLTGDEATYNRASTLYWNKYLVDSAHAHGLSPFYWSTPNSPFNYSNGAIVDPEVVNVITGGIAPPPPNGAPYAASDLTATTVGNGQISLSWTAGSGATSYSLYRSAQSGYQPPTPFATGITGTSYTDTGLNVGTTYYYQVVAVNASGPSGFSAEAYATTPGVNPDPTKYHFETDTHRWSYGGAQISGIATSSTRAFAGSRSLAVSFNGATGGTSSVSVGDVVVPAGTTITLRVWIPSGSPVNLIEPYVQDYNWGWTASWFGNLTGNAWNTINITVPAGGVTPLKQLGLRFTTSAAWTGTVYVDSVNWDTLSEPSAPAGLTAVGAAGKVTLNWSATATATTYNIKRSTTSGSGYTTIGTSVEPAFIDTGVVNGTTYYYVVSAANAAGEGNDSSEASAMPTEMRAHYRFDGNAQDSSGNAYHGTPTAVSYVAGQVGAQAGQFNGTTGTVTIPRSVTDDFTVMMWVKTTDYGGWPGAQWWAGKGLVDGEVGGGGADWGTALVDGKFVLGVGAVGGDTTLASSVNINDGAWHHVAATRNNTSGAIVVYVDGVLRGSGTGPTGLRTFPPGLRIGSLQTGNNFLNGTLDDVRLYDRILTGSEIAAFVNTPPELAAIGDSTVNVGQTVTFNANGTDNDSPAQTLSYALLAGPANATLDPNSGAFSFCPLVTQANTTIPFTLQVSDNGTPPLTATRSFSVTVNPLVMPTIGNLTFADGQFSLQVNGQPGPDYRIEASTSLTDWTPVHTANSPAMPFNWTHSDTGGAPRRFYRVKVGPPLDP